jgi:hypothetical protein
MADVSRALSRFKPSKITWTPRLRAKDGEGIIQTTNKAAVILTGWAVERAMKVVQLSQDGTIGVDELDFYFKGQPKDKDGLFIQREDTFAVFNDTFTVRQARYRHEGGFTKAVAKIITRRPLDA